MGWYGQKSPLHWQGQIVAARQWLQRRWHRSPKWVKSLLLLILLLGLGRSLPYLAPIHAVDLVQTQPAIEFTDRNGLPLGTLLTRDQEHTVAVPLPQVSPHFIHAIIAAEDQRFYQHGALDGRAIIRALLEAVQARQVVSGASTITMQLARMLDPAPRNVQGKIREIWTSWRLVAGMSKDEILQAYINRLPMGGNIYGVEAAARIYFGIPASDLNAAQASLLAAIPNDPNQLNPYQHWDALKRRQAYVLQRMVSDRYLTPVEAEQAARAAISLQSRQQGIIAAPHFLFWVAEQLADHPAQVRTTLDRPLQQFVEAQTQQIVHTLATNQVHHGAAIVLDNHTGEVLAYVGSPDYFADTHLGRNDGVQALRQPGSTLKPFLYQLALEKQIIRPNTILADVPTRYAIPGAQLYTPVDYSETFQGPVRVRFALANSLNIPAVRVLEKVGVNHFLDHLHQLGFTHLSQTPDYYGLGLALGSGEVSLWELAKAYLTLARQGHKIDIKYQVETKPQALSLQPDRASSSATRSAAALITDMLSDSHARARAFGVESLLSLPFSAAVKTGTSSDFRDTWTVGFTTDYTVATWVGNFDGTPMQQVSGVTGAAPLWNRIMLHLHEHREPAPFPPPVGMVQRPICALSGARPTPACPSVVYEYFFPQDLREYDRQPDPFYQVTHTRNGQSQYRLHLPSEYNEWLAMQPAVSKGDGLRILSPRDGDLFLLEPQSSDSENPRQQLEFKLATVPTQPVEWRLNGKVIHSAAKSDTYSNQTSHSFFWIPTPGSWTLQVKSGEATDQVKFQVQMADNRPTRRGFSFAEKK